MDHVVIDRISRKLASGATRRSLAGVAALGLATLPMLPDDSAAKKKKKKTTVTLCLNGQTVQVKKNKLGKFRATNPGATVGACQASCRPTTCGAAGYECGPLADGCGGTVQCGECGAGSFDQALTCVEGLCRTCGGACPANTGTCVNAIDGTTDCAGLVATFGCPTCDRRADCPADNGDAIFVCAVSLTSPVTGEEYPGLCSPPAGRGACLFIIRPE